MRKALVEARKQCLEVNSAVAETWLGYCAFSLLAIEVPCTTTAPDVSHQTIGQAYELIHFEASALEAQFCALA